MLPLNLLLFNAVLSFGNKRVTQNCVWQLWRVWNDNRFSLPRNSHSDWTEWTGATSLNRNHSPSFHFLLIFATHFSVNALRCKGRSKFIIHIFVNAEKIEHNSHTWVTLSGLRAWWWLHFPLRHPLLGFWVVPSMFICQKYSYIYYLYVSIPKWYFCPSRNMYSYYIKYNISGTISECKYLCTHTTTMKVIVQLWLIAWGSTEAWK
jgi:hypothetical protein